MHLLPILPFAVTEAAPISFVDSSMYPLLISLIPLLPILGFAFTALFVMAVAAGEATVGLAIVIAIYRNRRTPLVDEYSSMRE